MNECVKTKVKFVFFNIFHAHTVSVKRAHTVSVKEEEEKKKFGGKENRI